jgi:hypothetical protein
LDAGRPAAPVSGAFGPATWTEYVPANLAPPLRGARWDLPEVYRRCHSPFRDVEPADCVYGRPESPIGVVVFGDSHAAHWFPPLERIATRHRIRLVWLSKSACPSVTVTVFNPQLEREYGECDRWRDAAFARIERERPRLVVLANSTNSLRTAPESTSHDEWLAGLERTLDRLASIPRVTVLADTPQAEADVPSCLSDNVTRAHACALPRATAIDERFAARIAGLMAEHDRQVLDFNDTICGADRCPAIIGNLLVYRDRDHLTRPFALALTDDLDGHLVRTLGLPPVPAPEATPAPAATPE